MNRVFFWGARGIHFGQFHTWGKKRFNFFFEFFSKNKEFMMEYSFSDFFVNWQKLMVNKIF
jgi:hypothetical protein